MKTLLFNIPYKNKIIRRFKCSYNSPGFLFPPLELLSLGAIVKEWKKDQVNLIDAIAEGLNLEECTERIKDYNPDIIISIIGLENFQNDIEALQKIKMIFPRIKIVCFGYYPTVFAKEILKKVDVDLLLLNEPEIIFSKAYDCLKEGKRLHDVDGVAFKEGDSIVVNKNYNRIENLDSLPYPLHALLKKELYSESRFGGPLTTIQTSRGCPFMCNYCIRTYGHKITYRSPENIVGEIEEVVKLGIRKIRFVDDMIDLKKDRIIKMCNMIIKKKLNVEWTALTRVDTLDEKVLKVMKNAGCKRLYVGIESGSQKILDYYQKGYRADLIKSKVRLIVNAGIEAVGFFMVGAPIETEEDLRQSIAVARGIDFDYIIVNTLSSYPGTRLFEQISGDLDFQLFPYKHQFKDAERENKMLNWEKKVYFSFYFRFKYFKHKFWKFLKQPKSSIRDLITFLRFLLPSSNKEEEHKDYV